MRNYYRISQGKGAQFLEESRLGGYVAVAFLGDIDLTGKSYENLRDFNADYVPVYLAKHPEKNRIGAGLACGQLWNVA